MAWQLHNSPEIAEAVYLPNINTELNPILFDVSLLYTFEIYRKLLLGITVHKIGIINNNLKNILSDNKTTVHDTVLKMLNVVKIYYKQTID